MMDVLDQQDCESNIRKIEELLNCGIFEPKSSQNILRESAFINLMICLRDLLCKVEKYGQKISFTDDIMQSDYVTDVSDAVRAVRDSCCHIDSFKRHFDDRGNRGSFMVAFGKCNLMKIDDLELKSEYEDDVAVFYGRNRLYFKRHIVRSFNEARVQLLPMLPKRFF